jgi:hypothetical protein
MPIGRGIKLGKKWIGDETTEGVVTELLAREDVDVKVVVPIGNYWVRKVLTYGRVAMGQSQSYAEGRKVALDWAMPNAPKNKKGWEKMRTDGAPMSQIEHWNRHFEETISQLAVMRKNGRPLICFPPFEDGFRDQEEFRKLVLNPSVDLAENEEVPRYRDYAMGQFMETVVRDELRIPEHDVLIGYNNPKVRNLNLKLPAVLKVIRSLTGEEKGVRVTEPIKPPESRLVL